MLIADMMVAADTATDWSDISNLWPMRVAELYRNLTRAQIRHSVAYRVCQDLDSRFAVYRGLARRPDYRDELASLIEQRFHTRRAFCEATGLSEDMLSHVLAGRKHLAINTLEESLHRIGYSLHIMPESSKWHGRSRKKMRRMARQRIRIRLAENLNLGIRSEHLQITMSARRTTVARGR